VPDYTGRGDEPTTFGDVLIWVPRVIFSPVYLVTEFLIRRPMKALVVWVEDTKLVEKGMDFFGIGKPLGFVPTFYFDLRANPHFGIYFFWDAGPNSLRVSGSGGVSFLSATLRDRVTLVDTLRVGVRLHASTRSDALFYGIGPTVDDDRPTRYEIQRLEAAGTLEYGPVNRYIGLTAGERDIEFGSGTCCNDPSLAEGVARGYFPMPFGFADGGFRGPFAHLRLTLDSRPWLPNAGAGVTFDGEIGSDTIHDRSWARFGGQASASVDPFGGRRVVSLILGAQFAEPLSGPEVPFTELVGEGGDAALPAFGAGQLIGPQRHRRDAFVRVAHLGLARRRRPRRGGQRLRRPPEGLRRRPLAAVVRPRHPLDRLRRPPLPVPLRARHLALFGGRQHRFRPPGLRQRHGLLTPCHGDPPRDS